MSFISAWNSILMSDSINITLGSKPLMYIKAHSHHCGSLAHSHWGGWPWAASTPKCIKNCFLQCATTHVSTSPHVPLTAMHIHQQGTLGCQSFWMTPHCTNVCNVRCHMLRLTSKLWCEWTPKADSWSPVLKGLWKLRRLNAFAFSSLPILNPISEWHPC